MRWTVHSEQSLYAAACEAEEETGWRPGPLKALLRVAPTPGISDSVHHIYLYALTRQPQAN